MLIEFLRNRASAQGLSEPGPSAAQIEDMLAASVSAPDHGRVRPWRFMVMQGQGRARLGALMAESFQRAHPQASAEELSREAAKPMRAPLVIALVAKIAVAHPKIPVSEQLLAAGAAGTQLMLAANALGFGAVWKSGAASHDPALCAALGFGPDDRVIGFFYIGTDAKKAPPLPRAGLGGVVEYWSE